MPVRDFITKDFWLKLFSLALAVLIWVTVNKFISQNQPNSTPPLPPATSIPTTNNPPRD